MLIPPRKIKRAPWRRPGLNATKFKGFTLEISVRRGGMRFPGGIDFSCWAIIVRVHLRKVYVTAS
jgi:hypothetical protein